MKKILKIVLIKLPFIILLFSCSNGQIKRESSKIQLMPDQGKMHCNVIIKEKDKRNIFALTIPETIGCKERTILNFPTTNIKWDGPDQNGIVSTTWTTDGVVSYTLKLTPDYDFVDAKMTIYNLTNQIWHDVWSFNCLNPTKAQSFKDTLMERTYMATEDGPKQLSKTKRVIGPRPTIGVYFKNTIESPKDYPFVNDFQCTSPNRTDGNYLVTLSESGDSYMAATSPNALFLFNNLKFKCIHSVPNFGIIEPGSSRTVICRFYFSKGNLDDFINRYNREVKN